MLKFFRIPFSTSGDLAAVPDTTQVDGSVSYNQGYGPDYALDPAGGAPAKRIERDQYNQILLDVTTEIKALQSVGLPDFITSALNDGAPFPYVIGATVFQPSDSKIYRNTSAANITVPPATGWLDITTPLTLVTLPDATLAQKGIVQLVNSLGSSTVLAATQNIVNLVNITAVSKMAAWRIRANTGSSVDIGDNGLVSFVEGSGINTSRSGNDITIAGVAASSSLAGVMKVSTLLTSNFNNVAASSSAVKELNDAKMSVWRVRSNTDSSTNITENELVSFVEGLGLNVSRSGSNITIKGNAASDSVVGVSKLSSDYTLNDPAVAASTQATQGLFAALAFALFSLRLAEIDLFTNASGETGTFAIDNRDNYGSIEIEWLDQGRYMTMNIVESRIVNGRDYVLFSQNTSSNGTDFSYFKFNNDESITVTLRDSVDGITRVTGIKLNSNPTGD